MQRIKLNFSLPKSIKFWVSRLNVASLLGYLLKRQKKWLARRFLAKRFKDWKTIAKIWWIFFIFKLKSTAKNCKFTRTYSNRLQLWWKLKKSFQLVCRKSANSLKRTLMTSFRWSKKVVWMSKEVNSPEHKVLDPHSVAVQTDHYY